jgi:hypothetical protein
MSMVGNSTTNQLALPVAPPASSAPPSFGIKQSIRGAGIHNGSGSARNAPATTAQKNFGPPYFGLQPPPLDPFFSPQKPATSSPFTEGRRY